MVDTSKLKKKVSGDYITFEDGITYNCEEIRQLNKMKDSKNFKSMLDVTHHLKKVFGGTVSLVKNIK